MTNLSFPRSSMSMSVTLASLSQFVMANKLAPLAVTKHRVSLLRDSLSTFSNLVRCVKVECTWELRWNMSHLLFLLA